MAGKTVNNKTPIDLEKFAKKQGAKAMQKTKEKLQQAKHDVKAVKNLEFKQVSPDAYKMLSEAAQDAMLDRFGAAPKGGHTVPVDMFLDLPDNSRLKVNVQPGGGFTLMFGAKF